MKKLKIKTEKTTLFVVDFSLDRGKSIAEELLCNPNLGNKEFKGFKLLGKVSEITEEEWKGILEEDTDWVSKKRCFFYKNSKGDIISLHGKNYKESGLSLLKDNGVLMYYDFEDCQCWLCEESQQKVWSNPHVFIKID